MRNKELGSKIKSMVTANKILCIIFSMMICLAMICIGLRIGLYTLADTTNIPLADIGDFCLAIAYFIGAFLVILLIGFIIGLIASQLGSRINIHWYIIAVNTVVAIFSICEIVYDLFFNSSWLSGIMALIFIVFVIPVNIAVYIFCTVRLVMYRKKRLAYDKYKAET